PGGRPRRRPAAIRLQDARPPGLPRPADRRRQHPRGQLLGLRRVGPVAHDLPEQAAAHREEGPGGPRLAPGPGFLEGLGAAPDARGPRRLPRREPAVGRQRAGPGVAAPRSGMPALEARTGGSSVSAGRRAAGVARPLRASRRALGIVFFVNGLIFASWVPHIPAVKHAHALSDGALGLVLLAMAAGAVLALPPAGGLVGRLGSRRLTSLAALGCSLLLPLPLMSPSVPWLVLALFLLGAGN